MGNVLSSSLLVIKDDDRSKFEKRLASIFRLFGRDYVVAWLIRVAIKFLPSIPKMINNPALILSILKKSCSDRRAHKFALFISLYFSSFKLLEMSINRWTELSERKNEWNAFIAGAIASLCILVEDYDFRWSFSQYLIVRSMSTLVSSILKDQALLNPINSNAKVTIKGKALHFLRNWGNSFLFAVSSGQAVYSYVVHPHHLDHAYKQFLTAVTQMDTTTIDLFRSSARKQLSFPITCDIVHPNMRCEERIARVFPANLKLVFPTYLALNLIPSFLFKSKKFFEEPWEHIKASMKGAVQSSFFMSTYVVIFQALLCTQRKIMSLNLIDGTGESPFAFWWMGFLSAVSILIERASRRSELLLYMLPKAGLSLYRRGVERGILKIVKGGELVMFSISMATLMKFYRKDPDQLGPIIKRVFLFFLQNDH